jgi:hypothetical protein
VFFKIADRSIFFLVFFACGNSSASVRRYGQHRRVPLCARRRLCGGLGRLEGREFVFLHAADCARRWVPAQPSVCSVLLLPFLCSVELILSSSALVPFRIVLFFIVCFLLVSMSHLSCRGGWQAADSGEGKRQGTHSRFDRFSLLCFSKQLCLCHAFLCSDCRMSRTQRAKLAGRSVWWFSIPPR